MTAKISTVLLTLGLMHAARAADPLPPVPIRPIPGEPRSSTGTIAANGRHIAAADGATIRLWRHGGTIVRTWTCDRPVRAVAFSRDGSVLLTGDDAGAVRMWAVADGASLRHWKGGDPVAALAISGMGKRVLVADAAGSVREWDVPSGELVKTYGPSSSERPEFVAVSHFDNGRRVLAQDRTNALWVWDAESGKLLAVQGRDQGITAMAIAPDGRRVMVGGTQTDKVLVSSGGGGGGSFLSSLFGILLAPFTFGLSLNMIGGGGTTVQTHSYPALAVLTTTKGKTNSLCPGLTAPARHAALSPTGTHALLIDHAGTVGVVELASGRWQTRLQGASADERNWTFTVDGRWLMAPDGLGGVRVWDARTGKEAKSLTAR